MTGRRPEAGFTLLEVLVALVVLGFVVAGLTEGLRFGLRATDRQERQSAERGDLEAVDRVLRRLIVQIDPGTARTPNPLRGEAGSAGFVTDLGAAASALATSHAEVRLGVEQGRLVLRWRPSLHAARFGPAPPPDQVVLLEGVAGLELAYWGAPGGAGEDGAPAWNPTWQSRLLPGLVRLRLRFPDGSARHWPDIVAAPARLRPP